MFSKILIANRGEIACRIAATAVRLDVRTVAVYSDADRHAKHVHACDEAVRLGAAPAAESYLRSERIIAAALSCGAQAIHPGYGFLSENAAFAKACGEAGLVFIGPPPEAIAAMGSKSAAKALMEGAGVPLVPGYHGLDQDPALLEAEAHRIGYPVLIKASSGGGGKGMRIVTSPEAFGAALASCKREARAAFGDDMVLIEKYLDRPRHIEIQVFADRHGGAVYLFERDCSVQRRHQKVLEEAPAPGMTAERRAAMGQAAIAAARAVGYVGAGTVEFIANQDGSFYFMEMNTRLQVEHPVTEMITGFDLVEWQLLVAAGKALPIEQQMLAIHGHALEARLYAESPERGFLPSTGTLKRLRLPRAVEFAVSDGRDTEEPAPVRIDSGVREGDTITADYDPMIAKLIVWGANRDEALLRMRAALGQTEVVGLATNVAFLDRLVGSEPFQAARLDTGLIERNQESLFAPEPTPDASWIALAVAAILAEEALRASADPWSSVDGWRLNLEYTRSFRFLWGELQLEAALCYGQAGMRLSMAGREMSFALAPHPNREGRLTAILQDTVIDARVHRDGFVLHLFRKGRHVALDCLDGRADRVEGEAEEGRLSAPMPGKVVAVLVKPGERVARGAPLVVMEAMKMEHTIAAPRAGVVGEIRYGVGDQVAEGAELLALDAAPGPAQASKQAAAQASADHPPKAAP